jgi:chlorobactene glucosyltransferase
MRMSAELDAVLFPWLSLLLPVGALWLVLAAGRVSAWVATRGAAPADVSPLTPDISAIVPARNEADRLPRLFPCFARLQSPNLDIIVVDDHSTDGTAACAAKAAALDPRVRLVSCPPKPDDWAGKPWALVQGVAQARQEWFLFCDADVTFTPEALSSAANLAMTERLEAVALIPRMAYRTFSEALLLSCYVIARALQFIPARPGRRGMVQGAFWLVKRSAYTAVGGYARVRACVLEDIALGYLLQDAGYRTAAYPGQAWVQTAACTTWRAAWDGMRKHLFPMLGHSYGRLTAAVIFYVFLFLVPVFSLLKALFLLTAGHSSRPAWSLLFVALLTLALLFHTVGRIIRREKLPPASIALLPISLPIFGWLLWRACRDYRKGRVMWKGRPVTPSDCPRDRSA